MCLKKWMIFTFSNREAWDRLVNIVEADYGIYIPEGFIHVVRGYRGRGLVIKKGRDSWSYEMLKEQFELPSPPFKNLSSHYFASWERWIQIKEVVKDETDVFGRVEIEIH